MSTVVLVHGATMDGSVWEYQADALARAGFDPVSVDLPGHGRSEGEPSTTIKGYAGWLLAYLAMFDEPVHLVGHSMGALIVLEAAAARPDLVRSVTLMGVSDQMPVNPGLLEAVRGDDRSMFSTMAKWMYTRAPVGEPAWSLDATIAVLERSRPEVALADLTACDTYPGAAEVASKITVPMLLVLGDGDVMTSPAAAEPIAEAAPDATIALIEGTGHLMMIERPGVVNDRLIGFLRGT